MSALEKRLSKLEAGKRTKQDVALSRKVSALGSLGGNTSMVAAASGIVEDWEKDHLRRKADHHRVRAFEIAKDLPEDRNRAKAILDDAFRLHAVIHDIEASAVTHDLNRLLGE